MTRVFSLAAAFALACVLAMAKAGSVIPPIPPANQFNQRLDHFNAENKVRFPQKYLVWDAEFNKETGAVLVYTGNEEPVESFWNNTGWVFEHAKDLGGALVIFIEHRYFGTSFPFGSISTALSNDHIGWLNVEQALADYVDVLAAVLPEYGAQDRPVIAVGGSYGGMLASWARLKYPGTFHAALAASAPINAFLPVTNKEGFFDVVAADFAASETAEPVDNISCGAAMQRGFEAAQELAKTSAGRAQLTDWLLPCAPLQSEDDVGSFLDYLRNVLTNVAMLSYPTAANFTHELPAHMLNVSCKSAAEAAASSSRSSGKLTDEGAVRSLVGAAAVWSNASKEAKCFNASLNLRCSDPTSCGVGPGARGWAYLACVDFVIAQGTSGRFFPAEPFNASWLNGYCNREFGVDARPLWAFNTFGVPGSLKAASNIVFSNGLVDPWHAVGILNDVSDTVRAIVIPEAAHHLDLRPSTPQDPPYVVLARAEEVKLLQQWTGTTSV